MGSLVVGVEGETLEGVEGEIRAEGEGGTQGWEEERKGICLPPHMVILPPRRKGYHQLRRARVQALGRVWARVRVQEMVRVPPRRKGYHQLHRVRVQALVQVQALVRVWAPVWVQGKARAQEMA
jgi:hypothetical protein